MKTSGFSLNSQDFQLIKLAFLEDLGPEFLDVTTDTLLVGDQQQLGQARIISKHPTEITLSGLSMLPALLAQIDATLVCTTKFADGMMLKPKEVLLTLSGKVTSLLKVERILLNFLQRLCAVATLTRQYVDAIKTTQAKILDTRKTTPGFRHLEKYAVHCGGGVNHRMGLYDAIMIKDTHIDFLGGMALALAKLPDDILQQYTVIVEVRSMQELQQVLATASHKVSRVLLDNMSIPLLSDCVMYCQEKMPTEASGNIHLGNVLAVAESGVDYISIGKLTHSVTSVDLSMQCEI